MVRDDSSPGEIGTERGSDSRIGSGDRSGDGSWASQVEPERSPGRRPEMDRVGIGECGCVAEYQDAGINMGRAGVGVAAREGERAGAALGQRTRAGDGAAHGLCGRGAKRHHAADGGGAGEGVGSGEGDVAADSTQGERAAARNRARHGQGVAAEHVNRATADGDDEGAGGCAGVVQRDVAVGRVSEQPAVIEGDRLSGVVGADLEIVTELHGTTVDGHAAVEGGGSGQDRLAGTKLDQTAAQGAQSERGPTGAVVVQ